jgi:hypothetical protein
MPSLRFLIASAATALTLNAVQAQPVFVTDFYQNTSILRVNSVTGAAVAPPVASGIVLPSAFAYGPDGMLYATNQAVPSFGLPGTITKINPATGNVVSQITFSTPINPGGIAISPTGDFYISNFVDQNTVGTGTVQKFSVSGTVATPVGTPLATGLNQPTGLLLNGNNLYFTETNTSAFTGGRLSVVNVTASTPTPQVLVTGPPANPTTGSPGSGFTGMALSGNTLYYADLLGGAVDRFDIGTNTALAALVAPGGSLANQFPSGLYVDSLGSILVADLGAHDPTGAPGDEGTGALRRYSTTVTDTQIGPDIVSNLFGGSVINAVPEPGTLVLVGGAAVVGLVSRRRAVKN